MKSTTAREYQYPMILKHFFLGVLLVSGVAGVFALGVYSPLPTTILLDITLVLSSLILFFGGAPRDTRPQMFLVTVGAFLMLIVVLAVLNGAPLYDFAQAYRWVLYLGILGLAVGWKFGDEEALKRVVIAIIFMALIKATLSYLLFGASERPGLYLENNFEIPLFVGLGTIVYQSLNRGGRLSLILTLIALTVLAGSRSGIIALAIFLVYAVAASAFSKSIKWILTLAAIPVGAFLSWFVFAARTTDYSTIDRIQFTNVFLSQMEGRNFMEVIFGMPPITPLTPRGCMSLWFYQELFSSVHDGTCYSVIMHAFILRVVFDAGVFGLLLAFGGLWYIMRKAKVPADVMVTIIAIVAANSASVSGPNNPFIIVPVFLAILLAGNQQTESSIATVGLVA